MNAFLIVIVSWQLSGLPIACINASYSRADEVEITNDLGHLIIGAFAHHGPAFYESEVKRCLEILAEDPSQFEARNDLGAAYTKLEKWEEAQAAFKQNEELHPGKYETASNLGVMYKKMGKFAEAAESIRKALEIKPGGHMGLGDYYLQMIQWRKERAASLEQQNASTDPSHRHVDAPTANFLGVSYDAGPAATAEVANKDYVITLIKNDVAFSDAYIVLGDILFEEANYQMALRAYHRASYLDEQQDSHGHVRIALDREFDVLDVWREALKPGHIVEEAHGSYPQLDGEIQEAAVWLERYQQIEQEFIQQGRDVSFAVLKPEVENRGIKKPRLLEAVYYEGTATTFRHDLSLIAVVAAMYGVIVVFLAIGGVLVFLAIRKHYATSGKKIVSG